MSSDEITSPGSAPPPSAYVDEHRSQAREFAAIVGNMLRSELQPIKHGLETVTNEVLDHRRQLATLVATRFYLPLLALLVSCVALVVALVALLRGGA